MALLKVMTRAFARFARRERLPGAQLTMAVERLNEGSIDADLGGGLFKQRVARPGKGRSGGWRTIIVYRTGDRAVFVHGFAKSTKSNLSPKELAELKRLAGVVLAMRAKDMRTMIESGDWIEVDEDDGDEALQK